MPNRKKSVKKRFYLDYSILIPMIILCLIGVVMVYSATSYTLVEAGESDTASAINQAIFLVIGLLAITFIYKFKINILQNRNLVVAGMFVIGVALLLTRYTSWGIEVNGASGWLKIPGLPQIQPAEFLKILIIWYLAYILSRRQKSIQGNFMQSAGRPFVLVAILIFLVLLQPDTGGAAILVLISGVMLFASGIDYRYFLKSLGIVVVGSVVAVEVMVHFGSAILPKTFSHIAARFTAFANPFKYALDDGFQMVNSYYAIYNGGWFGRGLGNSIQKKGFLYASSTDFMYSIVIEELGLIVALLILGILIFMIVRILLVGIRATSAFNSLMCIGIAGLFLIQVFVNLGGVSGVIPLTGVTFPFISQGGSNLLVNCMAIGFALNISADEKRKMYQIRQTRSIEVLEVE